MNMGGTRVGDVARSGGNFGKLHMLWRILCIFTYGPQEFFIFIYFFYMEAPGKIPGFATTYEDVGWSDLNLEHILLKTFFS